jgi:hypothetical protein
MARLSFCAMLGVLAALLIAAAPAGAATSVTIAPNAKRVEGGAAVVVRVTVTCDPGKDVLEAHVSVSQDEASGMAGIPGIACDGRPHKHKVRVRTFDGAYDRGDAFASAFILRIDPQTQETEQGQDSRTVRVR